MKIGLFLCLFIRTLSDINSAKLYEKLLSSENYNRFARPLGVNGTKLTVKVGLRLVQILNIDEKQQVITTNVWLKQSWIDERLKWNISEFGGVQHVYMPTDRIWLPDIVLYNNAEGNYEITITTKALVYFNGTVIWEPPAIYKSTCPINIKHFPLDQQECFLKFGSWTYNGDEVDLQHISAKNDEIIKDGIDLSKFYENVQWEILSVPAKRYENFFSCCSEAYPWILFKLNLRRKSKFYTINMIIPCVSISFLTALVFYLPSDSGEKITLSVSILLTLTVFILQFIEIIPPTSVVTPLIGKYVLFTFSLVTLSVIMTIVVLSLNFRNPNTHQIPTWLRKLFIEFLPPFFLMSKPYRKDVMPFEDAETSFPTEENMIDSKKCVKYVKYIANWFHTKDKNSHINEEWKYIAMVVDRILLWIFLISCIIGTITILTSSRTSTKWDSF